MIDIYKGAVSQAWKKNIDQVRDLLSANDKKLLYKIQSASQRWDIPVSEIKESITKDRVAAAHFAVDPSKQKIHEKTAAEFIRNLDGVVDFNYPPNRALYVSNGVPITGNELKIYPAAKTVDFKWQYRTFKIYASHKYTHDSGGAQGNQYKDLQAFIRACYGSTDSKLRFIAIADGAFYQNHNGRANKTRLDNLQSMCTPQIRACTIYNLKEVLDTL